jgi:hypothetical protein
MRRDGYAADEARRIDWRSTFLRLSFLHGCSPDQVRISIKLTLDGDPEYAVTIKGKSITSGTNSISMITERL